MVPSPFTFRNPSVAPPRRVRAGLAPGIRQLHPSHTALLMNELHDASQGLRLPAGSLWFDRHQVLPLNLGRGEKPEHVWGAIVFGQLL
jgi:hypothetical protein